jgi:hypothetical protein
MTLAHALNAMVAAVPDYQPSPELATEIRVFNHLEHALDRAFDALGRGDFRGFDVAMADFNARRVALSKPDTSDRRQLVEALLDRDGDDCWLCGAPMDGDVTVEHLIARSLGGTNRLAGLALTHQACNVRLGNKPLSEKIALRDQVRAELVAA